MSRSSKRFIKMLGLLFLVFALLAVLVAGTAAWVLKDSLSMTGGSCKILFVDLKSDDPRVQGQARRFAESAVRRVRALEKDDPVGEQLYSQTIQELSQFCDKHPADNLLQLQIDYLGLRN